MLLLMMIVLVGLVAGFVDAIAGGGGLIMLPTLLFTGLPVSSAIATNKLCGTFGALTSSLKFAHAKQIDGRACAIMGVPVLVGAYLGSRSINLLPKDWAEPLVIVLMVAITLFVVFKPGFGMDDPATQQPVKVEKPADEIRRIFWGLFWGLLIGFHDGFFGPGTGTFLVFVLLSLWPLNFLPATGTAKVLNLLTNVTALVTFAISGNIDYSKGISGAVGVGIGSFLGATLATKKGSKIIKPIFIAVTVALITKLLIDYLFG